MKRASGEVVNFARERDVDLRIAAYGLALDRLQNVYRERDIFP
jgi:hypothetical protein